MNLLLIISGSIAAKKNFKILKFLIKKRVFINCIVTDNAKKIIDLNLLNKSISGKIYYNTSEKKNKMLHILLTRRSDLIVVSPATANIIA